MAEKLSTMRNGLLHTIYGFVMAGFGVVFTFIFGISTVVTVSAHLSPIAADISTFFASGAEDWALFWSAMQETLVVIISIASLFFSLYFIVNGLKIAQQTWFSDKNRHRAIFFIIFDLIFMGWTIYSGDGGAFRMALEVFVLILSVAYLTVRLIEDQQLQS